MPHLDSSPPPPDDAQAKAAEWVARRSNGENGAEEQRAFLVWLNASQANRQAFENAQALWEAMRGLDSVAERQIAEARAFLAMNRRKSWGWRAAIAAVALSVLTAGLAWQADWFSHLDDQTYQTRVGESQSVDLADGTRMELNTNSEARVHYSRHRREVRLNRGQAVFTVVHGDHRPFDVHAGGGRVRDIGTQFDVRYIRERVSVAVLDGAVEVTGRGLPRSVSLHRGEQLSYTPDGEMTSVTAIDINSFSAWRERKLIFQGQPLQAVLEELGRYHAATITVTAPQVLSIKVSGVFPTDNLPQALHTIALTLPIRLTRIDARNWKIDQR